MPVMGVVAAWPQPPWQVYRAYLAQHQVFVSAHVRSRGSITPGEQIFRLDCAVTDLSRLTYVTSWTPDRKLRCVLRGRSMKMHPGQHEPPATANLMSMVHAKTRPGHRKPFVVNLPLGMVWVKTSAVLLGICLPLMDLSLPSGPIGLRMCRPR
jgi:hypothetical protein